MRAVKRYGARNSLSGEGGEVRAWGGWHRGGQCRCGQPRSALEDRRVLAAHADTQQGRTCDPVRAVGGGGDPTWGREGRGADGPACNCA